MKKRIIYFLFSFFILTNSFADLFFSREIQFYVGEIKNLTVKNPTKIEIETPNVVDILRVNEENLTLIARNKGETKLIIYDEKGKKEFFIKVYPFDSEKVKIKIDKILRNAKIDKITTKASDEEGKIYLYGEVKTQEEKDRIFSYLTDFKDKIVDVIKVKEDDTSIEIDVQILEMNWDSTRELGFDFPSSLSIGEDGSTLFEGDGFTTGRLSSTLFNISGYSRTLFGIKLDLLIQEGKANILSRPKLVCRNGKEADLLVGGEVPVFTTEVAGTGGEGTNVEYKEYGIKLKIQPKIIEENKIDIKLNVEVSDVGEAETIGSASSPTAKAYPLIKRSISTHVSMKNNSTLAIGGLIRQKTENDFKKFPWLSDIPILGTFFRHRSEKKGDGAGGRGNKELFIFLTPRVIEALKEEEIFKKEVSFEKTEELSLREKMLSSELKNYIKQIKQLVLSKVNYPTEIANTGWEGTVIIGLNLSSLGEIKEVKLLKSSSFKIFDENALETVKKIKFPPFPSEISLESLDLEIPIVYKSKK